MDLVVFVGDYIYESSWGDNQLVRRHAGPRPTHTGGVPQPPPPYRTDPDLQRMHALVPWLVTWDDHEVDNDYANDQSEHLDPQFLIRRAAAYQAYYEHTALAARDRADRYLRLYERYTFGICCRCACWMTGNTAPRKPATPGMGRNDGAARALPESKRPWARAPRCGTGSVAPGSTWHLTGTLECAGATDLDGPARLATRPDQAFWTDGWDGYPAARSRLLSFIAQQRPANPLVMRNVHSFWVCDLKPDFDD